MKIFPSEKKKIKHYSQRRNCIVNWHKIWATIQKGKIISPVSILVHNLKLHADKIFSCSCSFPGLGTSNWKVEQKIEELLDPLTYKNCSLE